MSQEMSVKKDLKCVFNMPEQVRSSFDGDEEEVHCLPPYAPVEAYPVDEYDACPSNWMHGSDVASSYFVGVKENHGMWLDFNPCLYHTHDVAIVISIQGINPITGQKMVGDNPLRLEQYHKKCPVHDIKFKQDRYCEKCGFKWPGQNYLTTTGTPEGLLWLDGFRTPEGSVRQYMFTEDKMRGVAAQMIGDERVFAIGIAYYLSKDKKPVVVKRPAVRIPNGIYHAGDSQWNNYPIMPGGYWNNEGVIDNCMDLDWTAMDTFTGSDIKYGGIGNDTSKISCSNMQSSCSSSSSGSTLSSKRILRATAQVVPTKQLEIGAGALIAQRVYDDPKEIKYWEEKPAGMIYVNYCDEETMKKILEAGRRADKKDGFMNGIKVGG